MSDAVRKSAFRAFVSCLAMLTLGLVGGTQVASAQAVGATVSGVVTDDSGAVVSGAWLTLADSGSGVQRQATANERGEYLLAGLPPGRYVLSAGREGFAPLQVTDIVLSEGEQRTVPVALKVAPLTEAVSVTGRAGYVTEKPSAIGPWEGRSLQDTPYSVVVVPRELIDNLQATAPEQIYRVTPTIQVKAPQNVNDAAQVGMRGFDIYTTYRDGLGSAYGATIEDVESVEVFTGLSGFLYGPGNVGGMINYVSKQPTTVRLNRVTLGNNGGRNFYLHGDLGGPIDRNGRLGYRINAVYQDGETAISDQDVSKRAVTGTIDWRIATNLKVQFDAAYRDYGIHGQQASWFATGATRPPAKDIDTSLSWGQPWTYQWFKTQRYATRLRWEANAHVTVRGSWQFNDYKRSVSLSFNTIGPNRTYSQLAWGQFPGQYADDDGTTLAISTPGGQAFTDVRFRTGAIAHKLTAGARYYRYAEDYTFEGPGVTYTGLSLDRPTSLDKPAVSNVDRGQPVKWNDYSHPTLLFGDDITINDSWSLLAGLAHNTIDVAPGQFNTGNGYKKSATTPNLSLLYKPVKAVTMYTTYIEALEQGGVAATVFAGAPVVNAGDMMDPMMTDQIEVGAKWSPGNILLTTALFQIDKALEYYDLRTPAAPRYVQDGRQVHRGIEFTIFGNLTRYLALTGGVTVLDAKVREQKQTPALEGKRPIAVANRMVKFRAEHRLPLLPALSVSGMVSYASDLYGDAMNTDRMGGYTLLDIGGRYQAVFGQRSMTFRLDLNNVTDTAYWSQARTLGVPRTLLFSVSTGF